MKDLFLALWEGYAVIAVIGFPTLIAWAWIERKIWKRKVKSAYLRGLETNYLKNIEELPEDVLRWLAYISREDDGADDY